MNTVLNPAAGRGAGNQTPIARAANPQVRQPSAAPSATIAPALLTDDQSAEYLGVSVRKFHELRSAEWMPKPIQLGPRLMRWSRVDLDSAIVAMPRLDQASSEPAQLRRGKIEAMKRGAA